MITLEELQAAKKVLKYYYDLTKTDCFVKYWIDLAK